MVVTKDTIIGDILDFNRETAPFLKRYTVADYEFPNYAT